MGIHPTLTLIHKAVVSFALKMHFIDEVVPIVSKSYLDVADMRLLETLDTLLNMGDICIIKSGQNNKSRFFLKKALIHYSQALAVPIDDSPSKELQSRITDVIFRFYLVNFVLKGQLAGNTPISSSRVSRANSTLFFQNKSPLQIIEDFSQHISCISNANLKEVFFHFLYLAIDAYHLLSIVSVFSKLLKSQLLNRLEKPLTNDLSTVMDFMKKMGHIPENSRIENSINNSSDDVIIFFEFGIENTFKASDDMETEVLELKSLITEASSPITLAPSSDRKKYHSKISSGEYSRTGSK